LSIKPTDPAGSLARCFIGLYGDEESARGDRYGLLYSE